eukprot:jgi/Botrbrau1/22317/Bobra.0586s0001.1
MEPALQQAQKPVVALVGATLSPDNAELAVAKGWIRDPVTVTVGGPGRVPAGLQHRYLLVPEEVKLPILCRQLRQDLQEYAPPLPST